MNDLIYRHDAIDLVKKWFLEIGLNGDICLDGLRSLPPAQQWISCSERWPNNDGNYIVKLSYTDGFKFSFVDIDNFSVYEHQWNVYGNEVSAWMPLPQLGEGE